MDNASPLLSSLFFASHRPYNDVICGRILLSFVALTLCLGAMIFVEVKRSHAIDVYTDTDWLDDASHCLKSPSTQPHFDSIPTLNLFSSSRDQGSLPHGMSLSYVFLSSTALIGSYIAASTLLSSLFLILLQVAPSFVVWSVIFSSQILFPLVLAYFASEAGHTTPALILVVASVTLGILYIVNSGSISLVARLFGVSAQALGGNPGLILLLVGIKISLICFTLIIALFGICAAASGHAVPNPSVSVVGDDGHCLGIEMQHVSCCRWEQSSWVPYYLTLSAFTLAWVGLLVYELKLFTIGGTISSWYFSPAGVNPQGGAFLSLGHALGPSLGSLSLASLVMMAVSHARLVLERFRQRRDRHGILPSIFSCVASCLLDLISNISRFSTIYMSMSGSSFVHSCTEVIDLLSRNAMDAYTVWWLPPLVIKLPCILCSLLLGYSSYFVSIMLWGHSRPASQTDGGILHLLALAVSVLATLSVWATLSFFASALLDVVDSVFVCYAVDRDVNACSQSQVHEVLKEVPGCLPMQGSPFSAQYFNPSFAPSSYQGGGYYQPTVIVDTRQARDIYPSPLSPVASHGYYPMASPFLHQAQGEPRAGFRRPAPATSSPLVYSPSLDSNAPSVLISSFPPNQ